MYSKTVLFVMWCTSTMKQNPLEKIVSMLCTSSSMYVELSQNPEKGLELLTETYCSIMSMTSHSSGGITKNMKKGDSESEWH